MGETHYRSDVKEQGTRKIAFTNASLVVATIGTLKVTGNAVIDGTTTLTGVTTWQAPLTVGSGTDPMYIKLGSLYIISGIAFSAFTKAGLHAVATAALGVANAASIPRGTLMMNASVNVGALQALYAKVMPATWTTVTTASQV